MRQTSWLWEISEQHSKSPFSSHIYFEPLELCQLSPRKVLLVTISSTWEVSQPFKCFSGNLCIICLIKESWTEILYKVHSQKGFTLNQLISFPGFFLKPLYTLGKKQLQTPDMFSMLWNCTEARSLLCHLIILVTTGFSHIQDAL